MKTCKTCGEEALKAQSVCRKCLNTRNRLKRAARTPEEYAADCLKQRVHNAIRKARIASDPVFAADVAQKYRAYVQNNKERILAKARVANRAWRKRNPEKMRALVKAWKENNPEKVEAYNVVRRARRNPK